MRDLRKAAEMALEALDILLTEPMAKTAADKAEQLLLLAAPALRQALAEPEQKPSLWFAISKDGRVKYTTDSERAVQWKTNNEYRAVQNYYTAPPKRDWNGLTQEECDDLCAKYHDDKIVTVEKLLMVTDALLKEKNT